MSSDVQRIMANAKTAEYKPLQPRRRKLVGEDIDKERERIYQLILRSGKYETIKSPTADKKALRDFHNFLGSPTGGGFGPAELEPRRRFEDELTKNEDLEYDGCFLGALIRNNKKAITSAAYGSIHPGESAEGGGYFFMRFTAGEVAFRKTGVTKLVDELIFLDAQRWLRTQEQELRYCGAECVAGSEDYWNAFGMDRLYIHNKVKRCFQEIHYELPHLGKWKRNGTPSKPLETPQLEHYQLSCGQNMISVQDFGHVLETMWRNWYVHAPEKFDGSGFRVHEANVMGTLQDRILGKLPKDDVLYLLPKTDRELNESCGMNFENLEVPASHP